MERRLMETDEGEWVAHDSKEWYELQELWTADPEERWSTVAKFTDLNNDEEALQMLALYRILSRPSDLEYRMVLFAEHYTKVRKVLE
jgi:hypothetical protein